MSAHNTHPTADWSYIQVPTHTATDSESTIEICSKCRAERPDIAAVRVRIAALVFFLRQVDLEACEIADLLGVPRHAVES